MSEEIQKSSDENAKSSALAKIGLGGKQSRGAKWARVLLALLIEEAKKLPGGSFAELLTKLSEEEAAEEDSRTLEEILKISQQSGDGIKALDAVINLVFAAVREQNDLLDKIIQHLEREGLPAAPEQITEFAMEAALIAYRNRMAQVTEFRFVDYRGIEPMQSEEIPSPPLEEIYVVPRLIEERSRFGERQRDQDYVRHLDDPELSNEEREQYETEYKRFKTAFWRPDECGEMLGKVLSKALHAVVKGAPGAGKSTLVRYIARCCATQGAFAAEDLQWTAELIPIVLPLAVFADARTEEKNLTLREHLDEKMRDWGGEALVSAIDGALEARKVFVLLDGVDEIPGEGERDLIVRAIDSFLGDHAENRVLVTSRPIGYRRLAGEVPHFEVPHFMPQQVEEFVYKWQRAFEKRRRPEAPDYALAESEAQKTLAEIRLPGNDKVAELATNPLLLVVISLIRHAQNTLPNKRVKLYDCAVLTLMGAWNRYRSLSGYDVGSNLETDDLIKVWGAIGFWMRHDKAIVVHRAELQREVARVLKEEEIAADHPERMAKSYLDAAANRSGLLEERGPDYFAFWHPTFEEFLAATNLATPSGNPLKRLLPLRDKPRWRETILLTVGVIGVLQRDSAAASKLVLDLAQKENDALEPLLYRHLRLAAACVADDAGVRQSAQETIIIELAKVIQELPYEPFTDAFVQTVRALSNLRPSPETITALAPLVKHGEWQVRMEATRLFSNVAPENAEARQLCEDLLKDTEDVRCYAALGLVRCGDVRKEVWKALSIFFFYEFNEITAREFLALAQPSAENLVLPWLKDDKAIMRLQAALLLHGMGRADERVVEALTPLLNDENVYLKDRAAQLLQAMSKKPDERAEGLQFDTTHFQLDAAQRLLDRMGIELPSWIVKVTWKTTGTLYSDAVHLLYANGQADEQSVDTLCDNLSNEDAEMRYDAARLLHEMGKADEKVMEALLSLLTDEEASWRCIAAETLHQMGKADNQVVEALFSLVRGKPTIFRHPAKRLLQTMGKTDESIVVFFLKRAKADVETVLPVCRKVLDKQSLMAQDVETLRELVKPQKSDTSEQKEARGWLFEWLYGVLEPKSALAEG